MRGRPVGKNPISVRECCQCPFRSDTSAYVTISPNCNIEGGPTPSRGMPRWCPLRTHPITVKKASRP